MRHEEKRLPTIKKQQQIIWKQPNAEKHRNPIFTKAKIANVRSQLPYYNTEWITIISIDSDDIRVSEWVRVCVCVFVFVWAVPRTIFSFNLR